MPSHTCSQSVKPPRTDRRRHDPNYIPTPAEIRAACLLIQAEWTEEDRNMRMGRPRAGIPFRIPVVRCCGRVRREIELAEG